MIIEWLEALFRIGETRNDVEKLKKDVQEFRKYLDSVNRKAEDAILQLKDSNNLTERQFIRLINAVETIDQTVTEVIETVTDSELAKYSKALRKRLRQIKTLRQNSREG